MVKRWLYPMVGKVVFDACAENRKSWENSIPAFPPEYRVGEKLTKRNQQIKGPENTSLVGQDCAVCKFCIWNWSRKQALLLFCQKVLLHSQRRVLLHLFRKDNCLHIKMSFLECFGTSLSCLLINNMIYVRIYIVRLAKIPKIQK